MTSSNPSSPIRRLQSPYRSAQTRGPIRLATAASLLAALLVGSSSITYAQPSLVEDINSLGDPSADASPTQITAVGSLIFFTAIHPELGNELWVSDGTTVGTYAIDISPGPGSSFPKALVELDGIVYFFADEPVGGRELWRSDGSEAGTYQVADLWSGAADSVAFQHRDVLVVSNSTLYFVARGDGSNGRELWKSDGTELGTELVSNIAPGALDAFDGSTLPALFDANGTLLFGGDDGTNGVELWQTDGTDLGTSMVSDINGTGSSNPSNFVMMGSNVLFRADNGSDGPELFRLASGGTVSLVKDIHSGVNTAEQHVSELLATSATTVFFVADDGVNGHELWRTDGTGAGTFMAADIESSGDSFPHHLIAFDGDLYFAAAEASTGIELRRYDAGTVSLVHDIRSGSLSSNPFRGTIVGGDLYFSAYSSTHGRELWKTDGSTTAQIVDISPSLSSGVLGGDLVLLGSEMFFNGTDGVGGNELWSSDGTELGTVQVSDTRDLNSDPADLRWTGSKLVFFPKDGVTGREPWSSDGTSSGTEQLVDIDSGPGSSFLGPSNVDEFWPSFEALSLFTAKDFTARGNDFACRLWATDGTPAGTLSLAGTSVTNCPRWGTIFDGEVYFSAENGSEGDELWATDGTVGGTRLVLDINATDSDSSFPEMLVATDSLLFFRAEEPAAGEELWKSDGTALGTMRVADIRPGMDGAEIDLIAGTSSRVFFTADDGTNGVELWTSDGATTERLTDVAPGSGDGEFRSLTTAGGTAFFVTEDGTHGFELWTSDGTTGGTQMLLDINPTGDAFWSEPEFVTVGSRVFFWAEQPGVSGVELWCSDGSVGGTLLLDIYPGATSSNPSQMSAINDSELLFLADDGSNGVELWRSDCSTAGTLRVADVGSGGNDGDYSEFDVVGGKLYFFADDGVLGMEPWVSDGTLGGTRPLGEIRPGAEGSDPQGVPAGGALFAGNEHTVFFPADDGVHGTELFRYVDDTLTPIFADGFESGDTATWQ